MICFMKFVEIYKKIYETPWKSMKFNDILLHLIRFAWICWNSSKNQWNSIKIYEIQWNSIKSDDIFMKFVEIYQKSIKFNENPWNSMKSYEIW